MPCKSNPTVLIMATHRGKCRYYQLWWNLDCFPAAFFCCYSTMDVSGGSRWRRRNTKCSHIRRFTGFIIIVLCFSFSSLPTIHLSSHFSRLPSFFRWNFIHPAHSYTFTVLVPTQLPHPLNARHCYLQITTLWTNIVSFSLLVLLSSFLRAESQFPLMPNVWTSGGFNGWVNEWTTKTPILCWIMVICWSFMSSHRPTGKSHNKVLWFSLSIWECLWGSGLERVWLHILGSIIIDSSMFQERSLAINLPDKKREASLESCLGM